MGVCAAATMCPDEVRCGNGVDSARPGAITGASPNSSRAPAIPLARKRHDKNAMTNYVAPDLTSLEQELSTVDGWFKRVKGYKA
jgi:hypothetical protein